MTNSTTRLNLTLLSQYQAQKELIVNENFNKIDQLLGRGVKSYKASLPSEGLNYGDLFIVPSDSEGELDKYQSHLALFLDEFEYVRPTEGMLFWASLEKKLIVFADAKWIELA